MAERFRRAVPIVIVATAAVVAIVLLTRSPEHPGLVDVDHASVPEQTPISDTPLGGALPTRALSRVARPMNPTPAFAEPDPSEDPAASDDSEAMDDAMAEAWSQVDLDEVRRAMPDNLYFKLSVPTKDEAVLEERAAERARWNTEYGKILSGTGSEEEIRAYYDQQARVSGDYVEFTTYLLDHYRNTLMPRDVSLLELARRLHLARLEEMPRKVEEARERKRLQDKVRAEWLADEEAFGRGQAAPADQ